ncbi:hypothetical protein B1987_02835 [Mycobacterium kansasii]|nr:hypothetical protein B1987_02835 [Mycobacterium kansasii]
MRPADSAGSHLPQCTGGSSAAGATTTGGAGAGVGGDTDGVDGSAGSDDEPPAFCDVIAHLRATC